LVWRIDYGQKRRNELKLIGILSIVILSIYAGAATDQKPVAAAAESEKISYNHELTSIVKTITIASYSKAERDNAPLIIKAKAPDYKKSSSSN
jgi:hypothetical protein